MATPRARLTTAAFKTLLSTTLGNLKPYQIAQVQEFLSKIRFERGSNADVSVQDTLTTIGNTLTDNV